MTSTSTDRFIAYIRKCVLNAHYPSTFSLKTQQTVATLQKQGRRIVACCDLSHRPYNFGKRIACISDEHNNNLPECRPNCRPDRSLHGHLRRPFYRNHWTDSQFYNMYMRTEASTQAHLAQTNCPVPFHWANTNLSHRSMFIDRNCSIIASTQ